MSIVLITGCSSGIGLETALGFARRGYRVYATMRDVTRGDRLRAAADAEGLCIQIEPLDVTDSEAVGPVVAGIVAREGRIEVLVNNAGIGGAVSSIEEIDEVIARAVWETNFWAPFRLTRAVLPYMRSQGSGVIVYVSTFGVRLPAGPGLAMYAASKVATTRMAESLQVELTGTGIRTVSIEPGFFATEIYTGDKRPPIDPTSPYAPMMSGIDGDVAARVANGAHPSAVAAAIVAAVEDPGAPTSILVGDDAIAAYDAHRQRLLEAWSSELV